MGEDLDDILDDALEELDSDTENPDATSSSHRTAVNFDNVSAVAKSAAERSHTLAADSLKKTKDSVSLDSTNTSSTSGLPNFGDFDMSKMLEEMKDPNFAKELEDVFKLMNLDGKEGIDTTKALQEFLNTGEESGEELRNFQETLKKLSGNIGDMKGMDASQIEGNGEKMLQDMLNEFEKIGQKEDFQKQVEGMMKQLVGKEIMYEPLKKVCEAYPSWLVDNQSGLSKNEYERYGKQYQYFQKIVDVYETEPENHSKLLQLMQDMQEFGQPPQDIIQNIAPGLDLNFSSILGGNGGSGGTNSMANGCPQM